MCGTFFTGPLPGMLIGMFFWIQWHICADFGLFSHDSAAVMADKETMQDTSVSMDTSGLDPDSMAGFHKQGG